MPQPDAIVQLQDCSPSTIAEARNVVARLVSTGKARRIAIVLENTSFTDCIDSLRSLLHSFIQAGIMVYEEQPPGISENIPRVRVPSQQ